MKTVGELVLQMVNELKLAEKTEVECCGVTPYQGYILMLLLDRGSLSMQELSREMKVAVSTMTRNIEKLELKGFVTRIKSAQDARIIEVSLTARGKATGELISKSWEMYFGRISDLLGKEGEAEVAKAMEKLLSAMRQAGDCC